MKTVATGCAEYEDRKTLEAVFYVNFTRIRVCMYMYLCIVITYSKSMDRPGKIANPARGQLNRENEYFPVPVRA